MKTLSLILLLTWGLAGSLSDAREQNWYNFLITFSINPIIDSSGFFTMPRTKADAEFEDWIPIEDGCHESSDGRYPGLRMWRQEKDNEVILIFDANGFIAGTQSVVPKEYTDPSVYDFEGSKVYNLETIDGKEYYLTTAYFVDPETICKGRTQAQFDYEGTGYTLHFQNGPTSKDELITIPMFPDDMHEDTIWHKHNCFINMGNHYFTVSTTNPPVSCMDIFPVQLIYDHQSPQQLAGFVWQHFAELPGSRWERPDPKAVNAIMVNPSQCLLDEASRGKLSTLHHYFLSHIETCLF